MEPLSCSIAPPQAPRGSAIARLASITGIASFASVTGIASFASVTGIASITGLVSVACLAAVAATALPTRSSAAPLDATTPRTLYVGCGEAMAPCERGNAQRTGAAKRLPKARKLRWSRALGQRIDNAPVLDADGTVVVLANASNALADAALLELDGRSGATIRRSKVDSPASGVALLASGLRVFVTVRGDVVGLTRPGDVAFRTALAGEFASVTRVGLAPLPTGGLAVARRAELFELNGSGAVLGSTRLELLPALAVRANGDVLGVTGTGDLYAWRAGHLPRLLGTFGDRSASVACLGGPVVAPIAGAPPERQRVLCASETVVEQIDLTTGNKRALLARGLFSFRSAPAVAANGALAISAGYGLALGMNAAGAEWGPIEAPGTFSVLGTRVALTESAPLIAEDGTVLFGSSEQIATASPGSEPKRLESCGAGSNVYLQPASDGSVLVACSSGQLSWLEADDSR